MKLERPWSRQNSRTQEEMGLESKELDISLAEFKVERQIERQINSWIVRYTWVHKETRKTLVKTKLQNPGGDGARKQRACYQYSLI